jgi:hypothetical protein
VVRRSVVAVVVSLPTVRFDQWLFGGSITHGPDRRFNSNVQIAVVN